VDGGIGNKSQEESFVFQRNTFLVATAKPKHKFCFPAGQGKCF
jgi:hypothetical protein